MTFLVPYDGSDLSRAALVRAVEYSEALGEAVTAVAVVPEDDWGYARSKGWIDEDEDFDARTVVDRLRSDVETLDADVEFRYEVVDAPTAGHVGREIKRIAGEVKPSVVFVGSENAGQVVTPVTSVGGEVTADAEYDVHIVRHWSPTVVQEIRTDAELYPAKVEK